MRIGIGFVLAGLLLVGGARAENPGATPEREDPGVLRYDAGDDGLLRVAVEINGRSVQVVLDSAADRIYLPARVAASLGLASTGRSLETTTGSGDVRTDLLRVERLTIAGHELRGLVAGVAPSLTYALIGQSVLSCFRWSVDPGEQKIALERITTSAVCRAGS